MNSSPAAASSATLSWNVMISCVPAVFLSASPFASTHTITFVLFSNENSPALYNAFVSAFITAELSTYSSPSGRTSSNCQPTVCASSVPVTLSVTSTTSPALTSVALASKSNTKSVSPAAIAANGIMPRSIITLKATAKIFFILFSSLNPLSPKGFCSFWTCELIT